MVSRNGYLMWALYYKCFLATGQCAIARICPYCLCKDVTVIPFKGHYQIFNQKLVSKAWNRRTNKILFPRKEIPRGWNKHFLHCRLKLRANELERVRSSYWGCLGAYPLQKFLRFYLSLPWLKNFDIE